MNNYSFMIMDGDSVSRKIWARASRSCSRGSHVLGKNQDCPTATVLVVLLFWAAFSPVPYERDARAYITATPLQPDTSPGKNSLLLPFGYCPPKAMTDAGVAPPLLPGFIHQEADVPLRRALADHAHIDTCRWRGMPGWQAPGAAESVSPTRQTSAL